MNVNDHNRVLGILLMVHGIFNGAILGLVTFVYGIVGIGMIVVPGRGDQQFAGALFGVLAAVMLIFAAIFFIPQIVGGWKLYRVKPNARIWGIIGSILAMFSAPLGTALGVYGVWFLFGEDGKRLYETGAGSPQQIPPPPSDWR